MNHWLLKSEPTGYSFDQLVAEKRTLWTGVRNHRAQQFLRSMKKGELALFFHTGAERAAVGIARVLSAPKPDPTASDGKAWVAVELGAVKPLTTPVTLATMKATPELAALTMLRQPRLSVSPLSSAEYATLVSMGR